MTPCAFCSMAGWRRWLCLDCPHPADVFVGSTQVSSSAACYTPLCLVAAGRYWASSTAVGVETMQSWLLSCCRCRHENDSDLYCAFDPDVAHMLAGWGLDWRQMHCLGQATVEVGLGHM